MCTYCVEQLQTVNFKLRDPVGSAMWWEKLVVEGSRLQPLGDVANNDTFSFLLAI